jgi:hypothetical protein
MVCVTLTISEKEFYSAIRKNRAGETPGTIRKLFCFGSTPTIDIEP